MPAQDNESSDIKNEENADASEKIKDQTAPDEEASETEEKTIPADEPDIVTAENAAAEATGDAPVIENIEHIENVEITGQAISTFMAYFPHLVVGTISLVALGGLIFIMWVNTGSSYIDPISKKSVYFNDPAETARTLITYLVAVFTIVIALTLTLMAFFSNLKDFKERFAMAKEVLTILIGVLGTIIGFYFGSAQPEKKNPAEIIAVSLSPSPVATPNAGGDESTNADAATVNALTENTNSSKVPTDEQKQLAVVKEREGFENLIRGDYESAISAFQASENSWNGYHSTYDIARLLRKNKTQMEDPAKKKEVLGIIVSQYSYGAPPDLFEKFKAVASQ